MIIRDIKLLEHNLSISDCVLYRTQPTHSENKTRACQGDAISSRIAQYENGLLDRW